MPESHPITNDFLSRINTVVEENLSSEQFGVSELAEAMHMSRSNLLRKVKKLTKLSVSQLIRQLRLQHSMKLLQTTSSNVSEVSHLVGFSSTSYFIKCFREYYGFPPGEVGKRELPVTEPVQTEPFHAEPFQAKTIHIKRVSSRKKLIPILAVGLAVVIGIVAYYTFSPSEAALEKSIAVLPFKNDSNDSTNVYLINGLMESTLNNLQKINDLRVISRTSAEKYRTTSKSIPEMAEELDVNYFVEGSGQKIGDQILLNIQLIEATSDRHLWSRQYRREARDIFELQQEVAKNIAEEIQAIITPEEEQKIKKIPTQNLAAYDFFLKGRNHFYKSNREGMEKAIPYFKKALEEDNKFALAYADATIAYYYLDLFSVEKVYGTEISNFADKAMLFDPQQGESLIAKALSYIHEYKYEQAVPYLEKALEYNANSGLVLHFLSEFYYVHKPTPSKYLEYSLMKAKVDIASSDSSVAHFNYLQLSNAFLLAGFLDEALTSVNKAIEYKPDNPIAGYLKMYILLGKNRDPQQSRKILREELSKDTTRLNIMQEAGKVCYLVKDYESSYKYFKKFIELREAQQLDIYKHENLKIGIVYAKMGHQEKSEELIASFKAYADSDSSQFKHLSLATYYMYLEDTSQALKHLKLFTQEDNYFYWVILLNIDPLLESVKALPEFKQSMQIIETKFWKAHKEIKEDLERKALL